MTFCGIESIVGPNLCRIELIASSSAGPRPLSRLHTAEFAFKCRTMEVQIADLTMKHDGLKVAIFKTLQYV